MITDIYNQIIDIYRTLSQARNSLSYKNKLDEKKENLIKGNIALLQDVENMLGILEESAISFPPATENLEKLKKWNIDLKKCIKPNYNVNIISILESKELITKIFSEIRTHINTTQNPNFNSLSDEYTQFINQLRTFKILSTTENLSDITKVEISDIRNNLNKTREAYEDVNKIYEEIKGKNENFNYFIDAENNEALKELYDEIYKKEYDLADKYRTYSSVIFIVVGSLIILLILGGILQNLFYLNNPKNYIPIKYDLGSFIRFFAIFTLTVPAWYFARESSRHRQVAYKAKILGTELNAFPYYVKELDKTERLKMRKDLADKFFGQELYSDKNSVPSSSIEQSKVTVDALKTVTSLVPKS
ncbi:MAG: hypothetical protein ACK4GA_02500 [Acinetobacter sp.]|uniref:hypothetical protein n=1 Tax=Acinetobacter sp. TaxID=472 RepID=UPI00391ACC4F